MTIEVATAAQQLACLAKARIASHALQRFAEREDAITVAQAAPIDAALTALAQALTAAGITGIPATSAIVANGVKLSGVTITGTGTFFTPTVANGVLTGGVLSAS